jgi:hypothetical protein
MNREDIIKLAREAGFVIDVVAQQHQPNCIFHTHHMVDELLTRFANLVAAQEREACAFDAEWCIQNHLEHLMPERIRARRQV